MPEPSPLHRECLAIEDARLARVFTDERKLRILMMFGPEARSVSQAAEALGEQLPRIFYHVNNFVRQGLLIVAREEKRQGRPVRYYQTAAHSFLLRQPLIDRPCTQALAEELRQTLDAALEGADIPGVLFSADEDGGIRMQVAPDPGRRAKDATPRRKSPMGGEIWHILRLPEDQAVAMIKELDEVLARYDRLSGEGKEFLVHAAMVLRRPR